MKRRAVKVSKSNVHPPFPHRLTTNAKEQQASLELLFALQRLAYPELSKGIRMRKDIIKWVK